VIRDGWIGYIEMIDRLIIDVNGRKEKNEQVDAP
jgi:hypothetical protein